MKEETKKDLNRAKIAGARYDAAAKAIFSNREILAPILQMVVPEYKNLGLNEIIQCIDPDSICSKPLEDIPMNFAGEPTEMNSVSEKAIRYDIHFLAKNPILSDEKIRVMLHMDMEIQNNYRPGYPITKRAVYYGAREISQQLGTLTGKTNYGDIQKVYTIWICNGNIPKSMQNTVTMFSIKQTDLIGKAKLEILDNDHNRFMSMQSNLLILLI